MVWLVRSNERTMYIYNMSSLQANRFAYILALAAFDGWIAQSQVYFCLWSKTIGAKLLVWKYVTCTFIRMKINSFSCESFCTSTCSEKEANGNSEVEVKSVCICMCQYNTIQFISSWSNSYSLVTHICSFWRLVLFCSVKKLEHGGQINHSVS